MITYRDFVVTLEIKEENGHEDVTIYSGKELVRCRECKFRHCCETVDGFGKSDKWYCADGVKADPEQQQA